ncbi:unnamed protein product [Ilex paraguariensis]|uniref:RNase H type-1 domain-containing protein n=1 Tax=Ilex paraguariensis TaxID=185542 RepID=A0ABC8U7L8_9AQUA
MGLGCSGPKPTWTIKKKGMTNSLIRLDRALVNTNWTTNFLDAKVQNLPRTSSEHCPLLIHVTGWYKISMDGSSRDNPGPTGVRGIIKDHRGLWIKGFFGRINNTSSLKAELWAAYEGLKSIQGGGGNYILEIDSLEVINLLSTNQADNHPFKVLLNNFKHIIRSQNIILSHTLKEGNKYADHLANFGVSQFEEMVTLDLPSSCILPLLRADISCTRVFREPN